MARGAPFPWSHVRRDLNEERRPVPRAEAAQGLPRRRLAGARARGRRAPFSGGQGAAPGRARRVASRRDWRWHAAASSRWRTPDCGGSSRGAAPRPLSCARPSARDRASSRRARARTCACSRGLRAQDRVLRGEGRARRRRARDRCRKAADRLGWDPAPRERPRPARPESRRGAESRVRQGPRVSRATGARGRGARRESEERAARVRARCREPGRGRPITTWDMPLRLRLASTARAANSDEERNQDARFAGAPSGAGTRRAGPGARPQRHGCPPAGRRTPVDPFALACGTSPKAPGRRGPRRHGRVSDVRRDIQSIAIGRLEDAISTSTREDNSR